MKKEREWRDRFAQGKSRRENEKKRNIACAIKRDGEREREERSDGAGKASEREKEKIERWEKREGGERGIYQ